MVLFFVLFSFIEITFGGSYDEHECNKAEYDLYVKYEDTFTSDCYMIARDEVKESLNLCENAIQEVMKLLEGGIHDMTDMSNIAVACDGVSKTISEFETARYYRKRLFDAKLEAMKRVKYFCNRGDIEIDN
jgi:hypothetical protein